MPSDLLAIERGDLPTTADDLRLQRLSAPLSDEARAFAQRMIDSLLPVHREALARMANLPPEMVAHVTRISRTKNFTDYLDQIGASKEFLSMALLADIIAKPANRVRELRLLGEMHGLVGKLPQLVGGTVKVEQTINSIKQFISGESDSLDGVLDVPSNADVASGDDEDDHDDQSSAEEAVF